MTNPVISDPKQILEMEIKDLQKRVTSLAKEIKACNEAIALKRRAVKNLTL